MITGTPRFDISREDRQRDNDMVTSLYSLAAGTRVIIEVGRRKFPDPRIVDLTAKYALTLHLELQGDLEAVRAWERDLREAA